MRLPNPLSPFLIYIKKGFKEKNERKIQQFILYNNINGKGWKAN
jgi:hypothetical protein